MAEQLELLWLQSRTKAAANAIATLWCAVFPRRPFPESRWKYQTRVASPVGIQKQGDGGEEPDAEEPDAEEPEEAAPAKPAKKKTAKKKPAAKKK